ncbi:hypothetical protein H696_05167 [Fonticula alba]|uniref:Nuclear pore protein n=1 Tax=Fonticula alba TaxID=691883 RepID=A0A058Z1T3_FONAL|nr:hypothetical protein H696_05167 [Fonticula alba]KCV68244.1 hypothetical protein H696_05167 [Fonticula alba]|eukprot:XP_009497298.1 hypothetical protein H696_05167 [Fonticula alba]
MSGHSAPVKTGYRLERLRDEAQNSASDVLRREHSVKRPLSILQRDSSSLDIELDWADSKLLLFRPVATGSEAPGARVAGSRTGTGSFGPGLSLTGSDLTRDLSNSLAGSCGVFSQSAFVAGGSAATGAGPGGPNGFRMVTHYSRAITQLTNHRISRTPFPMALSVHDSLKSEKGDRIVNIWELVAFLTGEIAPPELAGKDYSIFSPVYLVSAALTFLEKKYCEYIRRCLDETLRQTLPGGELGFDHLVRAFVRSLVATDVSILPSLEQEGGEFFWPQIYYLLRCGKFDLAEAYVRSPACAPLVREEPEFAGLLHEYIHSAGQTAGGASTAGGRLRQLSRDSQGLAQQQFARRPQRDVFRTAVYRLICQLDTSLSPGVIATTEDYLWLQLAMIRKETALPSLAALQKRVLRVGADHFSDHGVNPTNYLQVLLLCGLFPQAVDYLWSTPGHLDDAFHLAVCLVYHGLLERAPAATAATGDGGAHRPDGSPAHGALASSWASAALGQSVLGATSSAFGGAGSGSVLVPAPGAGRTNGSGPAVAGARLPSAEMALDFAGMLMGYLSSGIFRDLPELSFFYLLLISLGTGERAAPGRLAAGAGPGEEQICLNFLQVLLVRHPHLIEQFLGDAPAGLPDRGTVGLIEKYGELFLDPMTVGTTGGAPSRAVMAYRLASAASQTAQLQGRLDLAVRLAYLAGDFVRTVDLMCLLLGDLNAVPEETLAEARGVIETLSRLSRSAELTDRIATLQHLVSISSVFNLEREGNLDGALGLLETVPFSPIALPTQDSTADAASRLRLSDAALVASKNPFISRHMPSLVSLTSNLLAKKYFQLTGRPDPALQSYLSHIRSLHNQLVPFVAINAIPLSPDINAILLQRDAQLF